MWRLRLSLAMATPTASEKIYAHSPEASQKVAGFRRQLVGSRNGAFILRGDSGRDNSSRRLTSELTLNSQKRWRTYREITVRFVILHTDA